MRKYGRSLDFFSKCPSFMLGQNAGWRLDSYSIYNSALLYFLS
jgi:hypothetical protein